MNKEEYKINAISPIDGRYSDKCNPLSDYFSEFALIKYRVFVEIQYFTELANIPLPQLKELTDNDKKNIENISKKFSTEDALRVKNIEKDINHDVKAVEYFIKEEFDKINLSKYKEFIHFGLTSQDINNTAVPLMLKDSINKVIMPSFVKVQKLINTMSKSLKNIPMIARTHGQPATPTTFGKEFNVFEERLINQIETLASIQNNGKFGRIKIIL